MIYYGTQEYVIAVYICTSVRPSIYERSPPPLTVHDVINLILCSLILRDSSVHVNVLVCVRTLCSKQLAHSSHKVKVLIDLDTSVYWPKTKSLGKKVKVLIHVNMSVKLVFRLSVVGPIALTKNFRLKGVLLPSIEFLD